MPHKPPARRQEPGSPITIAVGTARAAALAASLGLSPVIVKAGSTLIFPPSAPGHAPVTPASASPAPWTPAPAAPEPMMPPPALLQATPRQAVAIADDLPAAARSQMPRRTLAPGQEVLPGCAVARKPQGDEQVVAYGAYEGARLAPYSLANGERTDAVTINVEPGREKIYLILTSHHSMVWNVTGDTGRIAHVVANSATRGINSGEGRGGSGVTGLPPEKVSFLSSWNCLPYFYKVDEKEAYTAKGKAYQIIGRVIDSMGRSYKLDVASIPSMATPPEAQRRMGGGFMIPPMQVSGISGYDVVTAGKAAAYAVLPQEAGLAQLIAEQKIRPIGSGGQGAYLIEKPIPHYPIGLSGSHQVTFILGEGVPRPAGDIGHSCLRDARTGVVLDGTTSICP